MTSKTKKTVKKVKAKKTLKKKIDESKRRGWREAKHYGMIQIQKGAKINWVARETKHGWKIGLVVGTHIRWIRNVFFANYDDALKGNINVLALKPKK